MTTTVYLPGPPQNGGLVLGDERKAAPWWLYWFLKVQAVSPLKLGDSSDGGYSEALPAAADNQGVEIVFKKISGDANSWTIAGGVEGSQVIVAQYDTRRFRSDGQNWWLV